MGRARIAAGEDVPEREEHAGAPWSHVLPLVAVFALATCVPFVSNDYWVLIATRAAIY